MRKDEDEDEGTVVRVRVRTVGRPPRRPPRRHPPMAPHDRPRVLHRRSTAVARRHPHARQSSRHQRRRHPGGTFIYIYIVTFIPSYVWAIGLTHLVCFVYTGGAGVSPGVTGRRVAGAGAGQRVRVVPAPGSRYGSRYGRWRYQPPPGGDTPRVTQRVHAGRRAQDGDGSRSRTGRDSCADCRRFKRRRVDRGDGHGDLDGGVAWWRQRFHVGNAGASTWPVRRDDERAGRGAVRVPLRTRQDPAVLPGKGANKAEKNTVWLDALVSPTRPATGGPDEGFVTPIVPHKAHTPSPTPPRATPPAPTPQQKERRGSRTPPLGYKR